MKLARVIMALIFAIGCLFMLVIALVSWFAVIAAASEGLHWTMGALLFAGGILATYRWPYVVAMPWQMWMGLWGVLDDWLSRPKAQ